MYGIKSLGAPIDLEPEEFGDFLKSENCKYHHEASIRYYASRRVGGEIRPYKGKFGEGYGVIIPRYDTNNYSYIHYYIKEK